MHPLQLSQDSSILVVVDLQPKFLEAICEADRVSSRTLFLARIAKLLNIPVVATAQNPGRLGDVDPLLVEILGGEALPKMSFSAWKAATVRQAIEETGRSQIVLVGAETHICVCLSAIDMIADGKQVVVCPDAVSSRTIDRHKLGMERIRDSGAMPAHTESVAYEWLGSAESPKFREALAIVKSAPL